MFKRNQPKPKAWLDTLLPKKDTHRVRKGMITVGIVAAGSAALAALLNKKGEA